MWVVVYTLFVISRIGAIAKGFREKYCSQQLLYYLYFLLILTQINTLRLRHDGLHFADNIFLWILLNDNISPKYVPYGLIDTEPATSHQLNHWWTSLVMCICMGWSLN